MSLREKLEKYKVGYKEADIDWNAKKEEWKSHVEKVFAKITYWLNEYVENGYMKRIPGSKLIREENLGEYEVPTLTYEIGPHTIHFDTMGQNIIGGKGRIDVYLKGYKSTRYLLVLVDDNEGHEDWVLVPFSDKTDRVKFDKKSLEKLIESWIDMAAV